MQKYQYQRTELSSTQEEKLSPSHPTHFTSLDSNGLIIKKPGFLFFDKHHVPNNDKRELDSSSNEKSEINSTDGRKANANKENEERKTETHSNIKRKRSPIYQKTALSPTIDSGSDTEKMDEKEVEDIISSVLRRYYEGINTSQDTDTFDDMKVEEKKS